MNIRPYLPSGEFSSLAGSVLASALLIIGAHAYTTRSEQSAQIVAAPAALNADDISWKAALADIQGSAGIEAPQGTDPQTMNQLLDGAKTDNVTVTVGRALLIGLTGAKSQGLGDDIPTQESLVKTAEQYIPKPDTHVYEAADVESVPANSTSLHRYGNDTIKTILSHPRASVQAVYAAVGFAHDSSDPKKLAELDEIAAEYRALVRDLADIPVPQTLTPLHVQVLNDFSALADASIDIGTMFTDPLRSVAGLKRYDLMSQEVARVLTNVAQLLNKNAILFNKDEPGASWAVFLSL